MLIAAIELSYGLPVGQLMWLENKATNKANGGSSGAYPAVASSGVARGGQVGQVPPGAKGWRRQNED